MIDQGKRSLDVLSRPECLALLRGIVIGRVGFQLEDVPHILPVNCAIDGDGTVVFRTAIASVLAQVSGRPVVFETDGFDETTQTGWSVCVRGRARDIDSGTDHLARALQDLTVIPWAPGERDRWFAVPPEEVTGRRIPLVRPPDFGWIPGVVS